MHIGRLTSIIKQHAMIPINATITTVTQAIATPIIPVVDSGLDLGPRVVIPSASEVVNDIFVVEAIL